ncbi:nucleotide exchange factor GrpE [Prosthecochloris sp. HL-130-GSB]|jgi:molecular chaperone GrpE|uniref:Protein GrpE n=1 Tax=Prosthecochloris aestuarii TaxID=1102 RepID=A0A831WP62_PROAE|nr:nucleotide exchange factor GrpE [Prosthecochloris sp. HL-130-GSB]ARM30610.1 nucleotide exchange factor GrpE [Prosthecochloris sp. HL-130-GSB]MBO8093231.1 nucleotide exchange factor GrpE [Prosthecochloris sp.]HED30577.1 nucleotide exchange factor GrpE [Prosthecochloris aestuarii]
MSKKSSQHIDKNSEQEKDSRKHDVQKQDACAEDEGQEIDGSEVCREDAVSDERVKELEKALEEAKAESEKYRGDLVRYAADFENFRKQKDREARMAGERMVENMIRELLPLVDDVSRVMEHSPEVLEKSEDARPYVEGVELLWKNLMKWLEDKGVKKIEAKGQKMDVNFHEAISQIDYPDVEPETVVEEYQTGYMLGDKVLRHAKVVVSR